MSVETELTSFEALRVNTVNWMTKFDEAKGRDTHMHQRRIGVGTLLTALVVAAALAASSVAQDEPTEEARISKEKKVRELLELTGAAQMGVQVMDGMLAQLKSRPNMDPAFLKTLKELARPDDVVDLIVPIYVKHLDVKTLDAAIRFYKTPEGRKFTEAQPAILKESMAIGREWGMQLATKAMEEVRRFEALRTEDMSNVRNLVGLLALQRKTPMIDGRVDVYALVQKGDLQEQHFPMFKSARFGYGPSNEEIRRGHYENFPYERFRGVVERKKTVPLLWDKRPDKKNGRVVGFNNGAVKYYTEAQVQELLEEHGQRPQPAITLAKCKEYYDVTMTWKMLKKRWPTSLGEMEAPLNEGDENDFARFVKDPWGNSFVLERVGKGIRVASWGPDGKEGTEDDITYPPKE